ncbi:MAG: type VI secretion system baseplate subunit TssK [Oceanospirillaceae bacterium]|nr:type VI secretion system baseplate subunit TssK [Oceanospirillaceae bacterium]
MKGKVIWREGMFLRPQHFQQNEQYLASELKRRSNQTSLFCWGFTSLEINESLLPLGELSLNVCAGSFPDGTLFDSLEGDALPLSIKVADGISDADIFLAIPFYQEGVSEVGSNDSASSMVRYLPKNLDVFDTAGDDRSSVNLEFGELRTRLYVEQKGANPDRLKVPDGYVRLAVAHIDEVSNGKIRLQQDFIPCIQHIGPSKVLMDFLAQLQGMISSRTRELAGRASEQSGKGGVGEVTDFMLLQALNGFGPRLDLLAKTPTLTPFALYADLVSYAGELATFFTNEKRPDEFADYQHESLNACFTPLINVFKKGFGSVARQIAHPIPLSPPQYGIRAARINDRTLLTTADFIFAVNADVSQEELRQHFPAQIKIGPVEKIRELIASALPGIPIRPLPVAPREIPYHAGFTYFELDRQDANWKELSKSGGIAFHIGGEFPGLECQFYAIRRR